MWNLYNSAYPFHQQRGCRVQHALCLCRILFSILITIINLQQFAIQISLSICNPNFKCQFINANPHFQIPNPNPQSKIPTSTSKALTAIIIEINLSTPFKCLSTNPQSQSQSQSQIRILKYNANHHNQVNLAPETQLPILISDPKPQPKMTICNLNPKLKFPNSNPKSNNHIN